MAEAVAAYATAIKTARSATTATPASSPMRNARRRDSLVRDDQGERLFSIAKERPDSPHKIDLAMAAVLSWRRAATRCLCRSPSSGNTGPRSGTRTAG